MDEFEFKTPFLSLAANAGLFVGAVFWGFGCDVWGRRYVWSMAIVTAEKKKTSF